jgi:hypothetical protein
MIESCIKVHQSVIKLLVIAAFRMDCHNVMG